MPLKKINKSAPKKTSKKAPAKKTPKKAPAKKALSKVKKSVLKKPTPAKSLPVKKKAAKPAGPGLALAYKLREIAIDKKAEDIIILNVEGLTSFTDFFLICSGASDPQLKAIAEEMEYQMKSTTTPCLLKEGTIESRWIILNFGDVYVHVFHPEHRSFYALEELWKDGKIEE